MRKEEHKYETAKQAAHRLGITDSQVRRLCAQGRLDGAISVPEDFPPSRRQWLIPHHAWPKRVPGGMGKPPIWSNERPSE
jgi:hypothetical protein